MTNPTRIPDGPSWTLRPMRWWDVADLIAVEEALFPGHAWSEAGFWTELAGVPATRYYVVAQGDGNGGSRIAGYAGLAITQREADVQTVAVDPQLQGHGLGRVLLDDLLREAGRRGCSQVMLEVREDNAPALALYAATGFERLSQRRDYYGPGLDALVLRLRLRGGATA